MLWCTGLGSNSLTGSPKRNTNGCATYTYRCHPLLTTNPGQFWGRPPLFLFVIGLDAGQLGYSLKTEGNGPVSQPTPFPTTRVASVILLLVFAGQFAYAARGRTTMRLETSENSCHS